MFPKRVGVPNMMASYCASSSGTASGAAWSSSTLDLTGRYVLLAGAEGCAWVDAARDAGATFGGLRVDAYRVGGELADSEARFAAMYGISNAGAVLMRPDGYVAWKCPAAVAEPAAALRAALATSLRSR